MEGDLPSTSRQVRIDLKRLMSFYGFNRREAKIAMMIAEGKRLDDVANHLGFEYETVRKHLKNIFIKAGVDRQAMLVKQILMSPATAIDDANVFERALTFRPEHQRAGLSILSYFSNFVSHRYPDIAVAVSIEQRDNAVLMRITTPDGKTELVEKALDEYMEVVVGRKNIGDVFDDKLEVIKYQNMLEIAKVEIANQERLIRWQDDTLGRLGKRTSMVEKQLHRLSLAIAKQVESAPNRDQALFAFLEEMSHGESERVSMALSFIRQQLQNQENVQEEVLKQQLRAVKDQNPDVIERINEYLLKGAVQGAAGNLLYNWIQSIATLLPR